jgi:hypothetical protein
MATFKKGQLVYFHGSDDEDPGFGHVAIVRQVGDYQVRIFDYSQCETTYSRDVTAEPNELSAVPIPEAPFKPGFYRDVSVNFDGRRIVWFETEPARVANGGMLWKRVNVTDA